MGYRGPLPPSGTRPFAIGAAPMPLQPLRPLAPVSPMQPLRPLGGPVTLQPAPLRPAVPAQLMPWPSLLPRPAAAPSIPTLPPQLAAAPLQPAPPQPRPPPGSTTDLSTGVGDWQLTKTHGGFKAGRAPTTAGHALWHKAQAPARWLGSAASDWPPGDTSFEISFAVHDAATASLELPYAADNQLRSATLNGQLIDIGTSSGFQSVGGASTIRASGTSVFVHGTNVLRVTVANGGATPNPMGFYCTGSVRVGELTDVGFPAVPPPQLHASANGVGATGADAAEWRTVATADGTPYFYHPASGRTVWDWRDTRDGAAAATSADPGGAAPLAVHTPVSSPPPPPPPGAGARAGAGAGAGTTGAATVDARWDVVMVLPLPEELQAGAASKVKARKKPPGKLAVCCRRLSPWMLAALNAGGLALGACVVAFGKWGGDWHLSELLPRGLLLGAAILGAAVVAISLFGCIGAAGSREAVKLHAALLIPSLLAAAVMGALVAVGAALAVGVLDSLGAADGATLGWFGEVDGDGNATLRGRAREAALRSIYDGWKDVYGGCAPGVPIDGACDAVSGSGGSGAVVYDAGLDYSLAPSSTDAAPTSSAAEPGDDPSAACLLRHVRVDDFAAHNASVVCSSERRWAADFSTWASRECVYAHAASAAGGDGDGDGDSDGEEAAALLRIANCSEVVASLANTSDADGDGAGAGGAGADAAAALWLFCACAAPLARAVPTYTDPARDALLALAATLALGLVAALLHLQELGRRAQDEEEAASARRPKREEKLLLQGLQVRGADTVRASRDLGLRAAMDEERVNAWLIGTVERRVRAAGLHVRLLKLMPQDDALPEGPDERVLTTATAGGYLVALLAVGAPKGAARLRREAERLRMKLPDRSVPKLRVPFRATADCASRFELGAADGDDFDSARRQKLLLSILESPVAPHAGVVGGGDHGAGLHLPALRASRRLKDMYLMHADDEVEDLLKQWGSFTSARGLCRVSLRDARELHDYLGAELAFYFAWVAFYTRYLWSVALTGVAIYALTEGYLDGAGDATGAMWVAGKELVSEWLATNATATPTATAAAAATAAGAAEAEAGSGAAVDDGDSLVDEFGSGGYWNFTNGTWVDGGGARWSDEERAASVLTALYALFMSVWATLFIERWKRRAKRLALDWDVLGQGAQVHDTAHERLPLQPKFREDDIKRGFYTEEGDWVSLEPPDEQPTEEGPAGGGGGRGRGGRGRRTTDLDHEDQALLRRAPTDEIVTSRWRDPVKFMRKHAASLAVMGLMGAFCAGCIVSILIVRLFLMEWSAEYGSTAASAINALVISLFNTYWRKIALFLTTWENFRLERDFRAALIWRMFFFQFLNCYFSLFYIAFVKRAGVRYADGVYDTCDARECMDELRELLFFILLNNLLVGALVEFLYPIQKRLLKRALGLLCALGGRALKRKRQVNPDDAVAFEMDMGEIRRKVRRWKAKYGRGGWEAKARERLTRAEWDAYDDYEEDLELVEQYERPELKSVQYGLGATFYEFNELAVQFGYIIMFSVCLPLGALFALANNFLEIRLDALKSLESTRRVRPTLCDGIGAWRTVIEALSYLGVLTNLLILAFTSDFLPMVFGVDSAWERLGFVVIMEHLLLLLKIAIDYASPDVPANVRKSVARYEWIAGRLF